MALEKKLNSFLPEFLDKVLSKIGVPLRNNRVTQFLVASAALALLTSCTVVINQDEDSSPAGNSMGEMMGNSEDMFAQMMIPHHQQAIIMSEIALARSSNVAVMDLANKIISAQSEEITLMESWVDGAGHGGHAGHGMSGMATEEELAELDRLNSPEFDELFLKLMIAHHEGALDMVQMLDGTTNPEAKKLAEDIVRVQQEEIKLMQQLLEQLGS